MAPDEIERGLRVVRRKRGVLWGLLLIYLPVIWLSLKITGSDRDTAVVFVAWVVLVFVAVMVAAYATCPACKNPFHLRGFVPVWVRHCVHCGLPLTGKAKTTEKDGAALGGSPGDSGA